MKAVLSLMFIFFVFLIGCSEPTDPKVAFDKGQYETAYRLWRPLAEQGDLGAQNYLGIMHQLGLGTEQSYSEALKWYELSAKAGNPDAQRNLGMMYESGQLGSRDFEKAYVWLFAAYQQGNPKAYASLETLVNKLSPNNKRLLKKVAREYIVKDIIDPEDDDY